MSVLPRALGYSQVPTCLMQAFKMRTEMGQCGSTGTAKSHRQFFAGLLWRWALVAALLVSVWWPHYAHFWIDKSPASSDVVTRAVASPADNVLDEIARMPLGVRLQIADDSIVWTAGEILSGRFHAPEFLPQPMHLTGYPADYRFGPPTFQLFMAGLGAEEILIDAYDRTGDARFLDLALRRVLEFSRVEAGQFSDSGFLWNDHAIAARIPILARLWRHVRAHPSLTETSKIEILSLILRSGRLLADPGHFTVRTNHGVMQNVALLQLIAAFPALPQAGQWRDLAFERLSLQLGFYVSPDGMVLEHSSGYHALGSELLSMILRLAALNGVMPPASLVKAVESTRSVLAKLARPDGSLPLIGNTGARPVAGMPFVHADGQSPLELHPLPSQSPDSVLLPVSGYAIWWNEAGEGDLSQTVLAWAKHDGHGHKHADELAITYWSQGTDWITNTGYWPYGKPGFESANGWRGSNAPHWVGEPSDSKRRATLASVGEGHGLRFIGAVRQNDDGAAFRRQLIQLDADRLLVVDFTDAQDRSVETLWMPAPEVGLVASSRGQQWVSAANTQGRLLTVSIAALPEVQTQIVMGASEPFGGWIVGARGPAPTPALRIVTRPAPTAVASLFEVGSPQQAVERVQFLGNPTHDAWTIDIAHAGVRTRVARDGTALTVQTDGTATQAPALLALQSPPDTTQESLRLKAAYRDAVTTFVPWRDLSVYRRKLSFAAVGIGVLVEVLWFAAVMSGGVATRGARLSFHAALTVGWFLAAAWVHAVYFR